MIRKSDHYTLDDDLLRRMEQYVWECTGIRVSIVEKTMDEGLTITDEMIGQCVPTTSLVDILPEDFPFTLPPPDLQHINILNKGKGEGIVEVFVLRTREHIKYDEQKNKYYVWDMHQTIWKPKIPIYIATLVRHIIDVYIPQLQTKVVESIITSPPRVDMLLGHISQGVAQHSVGFCESLNSHKHLVSLRNGEVVDLRTGQKRPRTKEDLFTHETTVTMLPDTDELLDSKAWTQGLCMENRERDKSKAPRWERNMAKEIKLLVWMGLLQTGDIHARRWLIIVGPQSCGKTVFIAVIDLIRGPHRSVKLPTSLVIGTTILDPNAHTAGKNKVEGMHLGWMSETVKDQTLKCDVINEFLGEPKLTIRNLNCEARSIINTCKLVLVCNHIPKIPSDRRQDMLDKLDIITFEHIYQATDKNNIHFVNVIMQTQNFLDQVFTLSARYAKLYYDSGQSFEKLVGSSDALEKYSNSTFYLFQKDCLIIDPHSFHTSGGSTKSDPTSSDATKGGEVDKGHLTSSEVNETTKYYIRGEVDEGDPTEILDRKKHWITCSELQEAYQWYCVKVNRFNEKDILAPKQFGAQMKEFVQGDPQDAVTIDKKKVKVRFGVRWCLDFFEETNSQSQCDVASVVSALRNIEQNTTQT